VTKYLVDTNVSSELSRERPEPKVLAFIANADQATLFLSVMTVGEILKGINNLPSSKKRSDLQSWLDNDVRPWFAGRILPVTEGIAARWASLSALSKLRGQPLAVVDGLIAATALEHDLTLATRNVRDFTGFGIPLINPWEI
jgi:predicted nucleic acid-binding protein